MEVIYHRFVVRDLCLLSRSSGHADKSVRTSYFGANWEFVARKSRSFP